jgi:hypothetical protein
MKLHRLLLSAFALCFLSLSADAQYNPWWQWARADTFASLSVSGSPTVLGVKNGKALFGRITSNANNIGGTIMGAWTFTEYDTNGVVSNTFRIRGKVEMIDAQGDDAGNWYVLGRFYDSLVLPTITYDRPNPATNPEPEYFMVRIAKNTFVMDWVSRLGTAGTSCRAFTLGPSNLLFAADSGSGTVIYSMSPVTGQYSVMFRQGGQSSTTSLQRDTAGNIYIAGGCAMKGHLDFNGAVHNFSPGVSHAYVARYLPSLNHAWHYVMNDPTCERRKITLFKNKYLYYTGTLTDSLTLGSVPLGRSNRGLDYVAALIDAPSGGVIWAQQSDTGSSGPVALGGFAYHAAITPDTALLMFAQGTAFVKWGNGISTNLNSNYSSVVVSKGTDGLTRWARTVEADRVNDDRIASEGNSVWVSGYAFASTAYTVMDTLMLRMQARRWVPFVAKLQLIQPPFVADTGVSVGNTPLQALLTAPNPAHHAIRISGMQAGSSIQLCDLSGRIVMSTNAASQELTLDVSKVPRGLYMLLIREHGRLAEAKRIVLE